MANILIDPLFDDKLWRITAAVVDGAEHLMMEPSADVVTRVAPVSSAADSTPARKNINNNLPSISHTSETTYTN